VRYIFYPKKADLSRKSGTFFPSFGIYCPVVFLERSLTMYYSDDPNADLDDLIFDKEDGGPSER